MGAQDGSYTVDELLKLGRQQFRQRLSSGWGAWYFDPSNETLCYRDTRRDGEVSYWIPLPFLAQDKDYLSFILHLSHKRWVTSADLGDFVRAVEDIRLHQDIDRWGR